MNFAEIKNVITGEAVVASGAETLYTKGIESCVVICVWDHEAKVGGMAHVALPSYPGLGARSLFSSGVSPEVAFPFLISTMKRKGASVKNMTVRLVCTGDVKNSGSEIIELTNRITSTLNIPVAPGSVKGHIGKSAEFNVKSGVIKVRHSDGSLERV
ncbi:MAG: hypothetical protein V4598_00825 [Bdellovibrionota bacterium]